MPIRPLLLSLMNRDWMIWIVLLVVLVTTGHHWFYCPLKLDVAFTVAIIGKNSLVSNFSVPLSSMFKIPGWCIYLGKHRLLRHARNQVHGIFNFSSVGQTLYSTKILGIENSLNTSKDCTC